jgi:hypothetical protein
VPACVEIVKTMLGIDEVKEIKKVPLSNNMISRRIEDMSLSIQGTLIQKICEVKKFSLQVDESTDVSNCCQLIALVRIPNEKGLKEHYLFCKELQKQTTGKEIFKVINDILIQTKFHGKIALRLCTDGAAAMTGRVRCLASEVRSENPDVQIIHCFIHREALMSNSLPLELKSTLNDIKMVNVVKSRPLQSRLFSILCDEMGSEPNLCCSILKFVGC